MTTEPSRGSPASRFSQAFRYLDVSGIDGTAIEPRLIPVNQAPSRARQFLEADDVVISGVRVYLRNIVRIPADVVDVASTAFCVLRPTAEVDPAYLLNWITSDIFISWLVALQRGNSPPAVLDADVRSQLIPLPSTVQEQRRIAASIDALLEEVDDGEVALGNARDATEFHRQALLKAAVTGELTADWRAENPAAETGQELLARTLDARRASWEATPKNARKRYVEPKGPDLDGLPDLPDSWTWASVEQLGNVVTGATPSTSRAEFYGGSVPFFTPTDLDGGYGLSSSRRTITKAGLATVRPIPANSVMVTCIGATIGKTGHTLVAGATNQQINSIVPGLERLAPYLYAYFSGPIGKMRVIGQSSSTTLPILNKGDFSRLPVPLPPEPELAEVIARITAALNRAADGLIMLDDLSPSPGALRQSILAAAFRGDLIPEPHT